MERRRFDKVGPEECVWPQRGEASYRSFVSFLVLDFFIQARAFNVDLRKGYLSHPIWKIIWCEQFFLEVERFTCKLWSSCWGAGRQGVRKPCSLGSNQPMKQTRRSREPRPSRVQALRDAWGFMCVCRCLKLLVQSLFSVFPKPFFSLFPHPSGICFDSCAL